MKKKILALLAALCATAAHADTYTVEYGKDAFVLNAQEKLWRIPFIKEVETAYLSGVVPAPDNNAVCNLVPGYVREGIRGSLTELGSDKVQIEVAVSTLHGFDTFAMQKATGQCIISSIQLPKTSVRNINTSQQIARGESTELLVNDTRIKITRNK